MTRRLVDEYHAFSKKKAIAFSPTASLPSNDEESLTTIISLYSQVKDIYSTKVTTIGEKRAHFSSARPSEQSLDEVYAFICAYWDGLRQNVKEVRDVLDGKARAGNLRQPRKNHLLLRPIGQRAFAGAAGLLFDRGDSIGNAVKRLSAVDLWIHKKAWGEILWDPVQKVMLKSHTAAETWLLRSVGESGRSAARDNKLNEILASRH